MMGLLAIVSGCASLSYPLPKCDGYSKRPLNRSMWGWDADTAPRTHQQSSLADSNGTAFAFLDQSTEPAVKSTAFIGFDEAGSHADCRAG